MKKFVLFISLFFISLSCVNAAFDAEINDTSVRIRKGPGTNYDILVTVNTGTEISVVDKTLYEGTGCPSKWYKVIYKGTQSYVCSTYVSFVNNTFNDINTSSWTARVSDNNVNVRKGPGINYNTIEQLSIGTNVEILGEKNGFYQISYYKNKTGYMAKEYIVKKTDITKNDENYAKELKDKGFPDTYIPYLTYLHSKYPNWNFIADKTNLNFTSAVKSESGKNYMQTKNDSYRISSTPAEGSSWFKVNNAVIAFYMDPRNWLNEQNIFMFEKLDYSNEFKDKYPSLVKSIFGTGKLSDDKYTIPMVKAGEKNKISPMHIASRIRLEVGASGSDSTNGTQFTWKGKKYSGYYNFFNIGAYETTIDGVKYSAVVRGLAYAAKLINRDGQIWNNIETAISEGSSFLANGYVNKGQQTLYYQKFNVGPKAYFSKFTHQYMTNIQAPAIEGGQTYNSFNKAKVLSEAFIFEIPVFNSMPESTSLPNSGSNNNYLKSLSVDGYSLTPNFDKDVLEYEIIVPNTVKTLKINATVEDNKSKINDLSNIELKSDLSQIPVIVTSETGQVRKYIIEVIKTNVDANVKMVIEKSKYNEKDDYLTNINYETKISDIRTHLISNGAVKVTITNENGKELSDNEYATTNSNISITTAFDTKQLKIVVRGDTSKDGKITILDLLQVQKHIKNFNKLNGASLMAADTSLDSEVTILDLLQIQKHIKGFKKL